MHPNYQDWYKELIRLHLGRGDGKTGFPARGPRRRERKKRKTMRREKWP